MIETKLSATRTEDLASQFLEISMAQQKGMNPMEFSILYLIERQLPIYWQRFFEANLKIKGSEFYQFHAFIVKRNTYFFNQRRFLVLTTHNMVNVEADFNNECTEANFKKMKWKVPLAALKAMQIEEKRKEGEMMRLKLYFDLPEMNRILRENYGATKDQKKDKRTIKFVDLNTLRDFVFHLKRLYHLHRRSKIAKDTGMHREPLDVTLMKK